MVLFEQQLSQEEDFLSIPVVAATINITMIRQMSDAHIRYRTIICAATTT